MKVYYENSKYYDFLRLFIPDKTLTERVASTTKEVAKSLFDLWKIIFFFSHNLYPNFIKPSNIFVSKDSKVILTDIYPPPFDIDLMISSPSSFNVGFLAPKCIKENTDISANADLWSLGVLLTLMLTKSWQKRFFNDTTHKLCQYIISITCTSRNE